MDDRTDVLVIGGGATGTGIARDLALRGVDVTLAERGGLSSGTSGRSHGLLHSGARYAEADGREARECLEENRILRDIAGDCIRETGGLFVQLADDDPAYFEAKRDACEDVGIPTDVIDGESAREAVRASPRTSNGPCGSRTRSSLPPGWSPPTRSTPASTALESARTHRSRR